jgi:hypothetical protein
MKPIVIYNQNLLDIAIQEYGDPCAAFDLALQNNINITDALPVGSAIELATSNHLNNDILQYYKRKRMNPATNVAGINNSNEFQGIDYMQIDNTFKIR